MIAIGGLEVDITLLASQPRPKQTARTVTLKHTACQENIASLESLVAKRPLQSNILTKRLRGDPG
jgi:hypothetical protein